MTHAGTNQRPSTLEQVTASMHREPRWFERHVLWFGLSLIFGASLVGGAALVFSGALASVDADLWSRNLRGYTGFGEITGFAAVLLVVLACAFSLRKRVFQESRWLGRGTVMAWLWIHVYAGVLSVVAAFVHAGFGLFDGGVTTGQVAFWLLVAIVASGVAWRLSYRLLPPGAALEVGNYDRHATRVRAEQQALELEKRSAGGSPELHRFKEWLLAGERSPADVANASQGLAAHERARAAEMAELAASRGRALGRHALQARYVARLQNWRRWHVPLSLLFVLCVVAHVVAAYDVPAEVLGLDRARLEPLVGASPALTGRHPSRACATCHADIYEEWRHSMHARALTSPLMIVQANQVDRLELGSTSSPDPRLFCVNCHAPREVTLTQEATLPWPGGPDMNEGIGCAVCHQLDGVPEPGEAGFSTGVAARLELGSTMLGSIAGAVGNPYHQSRAGEAYRRDPNALCAGCHAVQLDRNADGKVENGRDLVLQSTYLEYRRYRDAGGTGTCIGCHMPVRSGTRAAASARIPDDQDFVAPARVLHSHAFVGADYPLDLPPAQNPHRVEREALLKRAAVLALERVEQRGQELVVEVAIGNVGAGHDMPTGFAFARQLWVELVVEDGAGSRVFESGVLARVTDDLCDAATLAAGNRIGEHVVGCDGPDPQLVNLQRMLVDLVDVKRDAVQNVVLSSRGEPIAVAAPGAQEVSIQKLAGGAVARVRPSDQQPLTGLEPNETRRFAYRVPLAGARGTLRVRARLLFRHLPPYFLRDLASRQPEGETPLLAPLIENLEILPLKQAERRLN
ncbi:MAG TPA: multiheme c-type cytochrome [Polyangiaceae bacterium]